MIYLPEKAKLITKLFNTVPEYRRILLFDDESIKQWISHMKDVTNSKHQPMMMAISKVCHLGVVHAKGSWGGPPREM
jgi:succinate dehydrogenase flavin-adding protein (antitoxin of CptAB toxin-antitoxin module)